MVSGQSSKYILLDRKSWLIACIEDCSALHTLAIMSMLVISTDFNTTADYLNQLKTQDQAVQHAEV